MNWYFQGTERTQQDILLLLQPEIPGTRVFIMGHSTVGWMSLSQSLITSPSITRLETFCCTSQLHLYHSELQSALFFTLRWYSLTTELKYQYFAIPTLASQHLSITICDKCQAILGSSAAHTNMMMHFEASLNNSWQQLIVNFNQVVFCSCYGLWHEHDKAVHHLFKLSVAWM